MEALDNISCPITPVADSHLANKAYVDAAVASGAGTASVSGDNVVSIPAHSLISCDIEPTEDAHLVNKAYVDAAVAAAGTATPIEEPAALGRVVYVTTLSDAADHTGTSLRDAIEAVTSNTSVVIKFSVSGTITLEQGEIVIPVGNIAIDGEDKITISGGGVSRIFSITTEYTVLSLHRLVITGGNGVGAVNSQVYGGAIYMDSQSVLEAVAVTFRNNSISGTKSKLGGGAIACAAGRACCSRCTFESNAVETTGTECSGGAICTDGSLTKLVCENCTFSNNRVVAKTRGLGGAVASQNATIRNCIFVENTCNVVGTSSASRGGAIYAYEGSLFVDMCAFDRNTTAVYASTERGGAISTYANYYTHIANSDFTGNSSGYGGAVCLYGVTVRMLYARICGCKFSANGTSSSGRGLGICVHYQSVTVEDCVFENHYNGTKTASGVVYSYGYTGTPYQMSLNRCIFADNTLTSTTNGLIYCANYADVYVYNSVFTGNSAGTAGVNVACLYTTGNSTITAGNLTMTDNEKFRSVRAASGSIKIYNSVDVGNVAVPTVTDVTAISMLSNWNYGTGRIAYNSSRPLFAADGYTPVAGSQVIDAGDNDYVETVYDLVGKARVSGARVDVGAVEWQSS